MIFSFLVDPQIRSCIDVNLESSLNLKLITIARFLRHIVFYDLHVLSHTGQNYLMLIG
jgi:hypothetical protein